MPSYFEFDRKNRLLVLVAEGDIQDAEVLVVKQNIAERVSQWNPVGGITDASGITKFNVSAEVIQTAARQPSPYPESTPWFIVAPQEYLFGVARMYEQIGSGKSPRLRVVRSRHAAFAALGVAETAFERIK